MWQRKQTVFLVLAALSAVATWWFPVATYLRGQDLFRFSTTGLYKADGTEVVDVALKVPFSVLFTVIAVALVACIFFYANRPRQARFVRGTYLITLGAIAFLFITDNSISSFLEDGVGRMSSSYGVSFFLPLATLLFSILAERAIRADEALVRNADRLR